MKKIIFNLIMAFAMIVSFASCDSDDTISVPKDQKQDVNLSMYEQIFGIRFACDGKWNAEIIYSDSEETDWLTLTQESGSGDGEIKCIVPSNGGDQKRQAIIKLTSGSSSITFNVVQNSITEELANIDINDEGFDASKFGNNIPLGYGIAINKNTCVGGVTITKKQIFTIKNWNNAALNDYNLAETIISEPYNATILDFNTANSIDSAFKSIKGNLQVDMSFAMFKLGLRGHMNLANVTTGKKITAGCVTPYPIMTYIINYDDVMYKYKEAQGDGIEEANLILSSTFIKQKNKIENAINNNKSDSIKILLNKLNLDYGPVFCTSVEIGGDVNITSSMEMSSMADTMDIGGKLAAGFSGAFKINGEVEVNYLSQAFSKVTNYNVQMMIKGGTSEARSNLTTDIMDLLTKMQQNAASLDSMTRISSTIVKKLNNWAKGITEKDPTSYTCTNITTAPIWDLFDDKYKGVIKNYFKEKYPNKANGECPYLFNIQEIAE